MLKINNIIPNPIATNQLVGKLKTKLIGICGGSAFLLGGFTHTLNTFNNELKDMVSGVFFMALGLIFLISFTQMK